MSLERLERVAAVAMARPVASPPGPEDDRVALRIGELVQLSLDDGENGQILAQTIDGKVLRLSGMDDMLDKLLPGEVLQLRVSATEPQLELTVVETRQRTAPAADEMLAPELQAAMRMDQAGLSKQVQWQAPDAAALASSWRLMVLSYLQRQSAFREQTFGQHLQGSILMADAPPPMPRGVYEHTPNIEAESWLFAAYAWGGQKLMLRVLGSDADESADKKGRPDKIALRIELVLAELGHIGIQLELLAGALLLDLSTAQASGMQHLQKLLPALASAITRSGLRIARCRLMRKLPAIGAQSDLQVPARSAAMRPELFRAMAEALIVLTQPAA